MREYYAEQRRLPPYKNLVIDLALHLQNRAGIGTTVIIARRPAVFMSTVRKRWMSLERFARSQYAATLKTSREAWGAEVLRMENTYFDRATYKRLKTPPDPGQPKIVIIDPATLADLPPDYNTLYLTIPLHELTRQILESRVVRGGLVVEYMTVGTV